jgi:hypothetical protein
MATLQQLERALINADKAGDTDAARKLAAVITRARQDTSLQIPDTQVPETVQPVPSTTIGEKLVGTGETALAMGTGAVGGTLGMLGGTLKGLAEQILSGQFGTPQAARLVEQSAAKGAQALTYEPRTQAGQEQTRAVGEALQQILPVTPLTGELGMIAQGTKAARPAIQAGTGIATEAAQQAAQAVKPVAQRAITAVRERAAPVQRGSVGAAATPDALMRETGAAELPVPIKLTEGQKTRTFEQQRFEREIAKNPEIGEPIRERFAQQNKQLIQNMDAFIDATGAQAPDLRTIGVSVTEALRSRAAKDKAQIRTLYKEAEKAGELAAPVDFAPIADYLNQNRAGRSSAPILQTIADELKVQEVGGGALAEGTISTGTVTLQQAEKIRAAINRFAKQNDPNDLRVASELKSLIDAQTEGTGGNLYSKARAARARYSQNYEDIGIVKNMLGTKRGSVDRVIALEDVLNRSIVAPTASLDSVRQIRRLLQTEGAKGSQAWNELQGGTLAYIRDQATKNVARDTMGNPIVSAAQLDRVISALDKSGKLDFIYGKKGGEKIRLLNDIAKDVLTSPPGAINTSNTASVILAALDMGISGAAGVPAPVLTGVRMAGKYIKDAKLKARVKKALGE